MIDTKDFNPTYQLKFVIILSVINKQIIFIYVLQFTSNFIIIII